MARTRKSPIVGLDGKPFELDVLTREIATASLTGVRTVWNHGSVASNLTPDRLARILRSAEEGEHKDYLTLAEEMEERDPHYGSVLGTRKRAVSGLEVAVEAASEDAKDQDMAEAVRDLVRRPEFGDMLDDCLDAIGKGYSAIEMMWDRSSSPWMPVQYIWRDPRFFMLDRIQGRELRLIDEADLFYGVPLPAYKFIVHQPRLKSGLTIRGGVARLAAAAYMCKAFTLTDWMAFAEVFGMPLRVGKYGANATETDIETLISAVTNIGTDAGAVIPDSMKIEFEDKGTSSGGDSLYEKLASWLDKQVSKGVLGQTMTSDDGSSRSQAQVHNEVRSDILRADARQLENTLNRDLVKAFIDLNFGPQEEYPRIQLLVREAEDLQAMSDALEKLVKVGLKVEQRVVRERLGFPDPEEGAELLVPPAPAETQPPATESAANRQQACPGCGKAHNNIAPPAVDQLDEIEADAMKDWQQQLDPVINPVQQLADECHSYEEFMRRLPELMSIMDSGVLVQALASAAFKARAEGDATT